MVHINIEGNKGAATWMVDGNKMGEMTFSLSASIMIIDHTEVDPSLKGQGVGLKLWHAALDYARNENLKIVPLCPFAYKMFQRHPETHDLLSGGALN